VPLLATLPTLAIASRIAPRHSLLSPRAARANRAACRLRGRARRGVTVGRGALPWRRNGRRCERHVGDSGDVDRSPRLSRRPHRPGRVREDAVAGGLGAQRRGPGADRWSGRRRSARRRPAHGRRRAPGTRAAGRLRRCPCGTRLGCRSSASPRTSPGARSSRWAASTQATALRSPQTARALSHADPVERRAGSAQVRSRPSDAAVAGDPAEALTSGGLWYGPRSRPASSPRAATSATASPSLIRITVGLSPSRLTSP
jgi:hypothetical protein